MLDAAVVGHGDAAVDSCDVAVVPPSISSSCDSGQAAGTVSSFGGVPARPHDFQPHESAVAVAGLTSSEDFSESEQAASIAARSGGVPPSGEFVNGYCIIRRVDNQRGDWKAMIAYLVVDLIASGRAVVSRDREMLRSWRHNYGAVLRRSGNKRSLPTVAVTTSSRTSNPADSSVDAEAHASVASESAIEEVPKKKAKVTKEPSAGKLRAPAVPERVSQRSGVPPVLFDPDGPPTEEYFLSASGAMASAGRSRRASAFDGLRASIATSSHVSVSVSTVAMASTDGSALVPPPARTATPDLFRPGRTSSRVPRCEGCRAGWSDVAMAEALLGSVQSIIRALDGALVDCIGALVSARLRFGDEDDDEDHGV